MRIAMINASPKSSNSASAELLKDLKACMKKDHIYSDITFHNSDVSDAAISNLNVCDAWVFAFPLYVDGVPSHLLSCLQQIETSDIPNKNIMIYCIVNSGFYEGKQNAIAIEIMKNWCYKSGLQWGSGIGVGGGGGLSQMKSAPIGKGPKASLGKAFSTLGNHIENKTTSENIYISIDFPRWLYKLAAETGWKQQIKKNGGKTKDLSRRY